MAQSSSEFSRRTAGRAHRQRPIAPAPVLRDEAQPFVPTLLAAGTLTHAPVDTARLAGDVRRRSWQPARFGRDSLCARHWQSSSKILGYQMPGCLTPFTQSFGPDILVRTRPRLTVAAFSLHNVVQRRQDGSMLAAQDSERVLGARRGNVLRHETGPRE